MVWQWLSDNWIRIPEVLSVVFAGLEIQRSTKARRLSDLFILTQNHRELWTLPIKLPALRRVLLLHRDLYREPLTIEEKEFINLIFLHLKSAFEALKNGLPFKEESLKSDIREFFALPTTSHFWDVSGEFFDRDFREYIQGCITQINREG